MTLTPRISIATMMTVLPLKGKIFFKKSADGYFTTSDIGPKITIVVKDPADVEQMRASHFCDTRIFFIS